MHIDVLSKQFFDHAKYFRGCSDVTIKRYRQAILFYMAFASVERITEVTEENVRALFFDGRIKRGWSTNTYYSYHKSLMVFFRWCKERGYLAENPMERIELPRPEKKLPPKLTRQDTLRLLEVVDNYPYQNKFLRYRNHAIFATFIFAGLRKKELLNMKLADVDLDGLTLFVYQGKGAKDRIIPVSYTLAHSLKRYLEERKRLQRTCPEFFTSVSENKGMPEVALKRLVAAIAGASRLKFTAHKLRHTFATLMLEGGCDIYSLSRMMGHNDIRTTTIYLYASADHLRSQISKHPLN